MGRQVEVMGLARRWAGFAAVGLMLAGAGGLYGETHSAIQAVDALGNGTHAKLMGPGVLVDPARRVVLEGVALNAPDELGDPATTLLIAFQGEGSDHAGTQIWSGIFFHDPVEWMTDYGSYFNIQPGDRIRVDGYIATLVGKTNVNEQHSDDPARDFVIDVIGHPGMPVPEVIPDAATATTFDATRASGGEFYQSRWVRMNGLGITPATVGLWGTGQQVTVEDGTGSLGMMLSVTGDFSVVVPPVGLFDVVALFDQEPNPLNFAASRTQHYRLWVKRSEHILPPGTPFLATAVSRKVHGAAGPFDIDVSIPNALEPRLGGPTELVVTFDMDITGAGGLDVGDVSVTSGSVIGVSAAGNVLTVNMMGTAEQDDVMVSFPGIVSAAGGVPVVQDLGFAVLTGDVDRNATVNIFDLLAVRAKLTQAVTSGSFTHDVDATGAITIFDLLAVRARLNRWLPS